MQVCLYSLLWYCFLRNTQHLYISWNRFALSSCRPLMFFVGIRLVKFSSRLILDFSIAKMYNKVLTSIVGIFIVLKSILDKSRVTFLFRYVSFLCVKVFNFFSHFPFEIQILFFSSSKVNVGYSIRIIYNSEVFSTSSTASGENVVFKGIKSKQIFGNKLSSSISLSFVLAKTPSFFGENTLVYHLLM